MNTAALSCICKQVRRDIINMTANAGSGHPGGSLSATELMTTLFFRQMRIDPKNPIGKLFRCRMVASVHVDFHRTGCRGSCLYPACHRTLCAGYSGIQTSHCTTNSQIFFRLCFRSKALIYCSRISHYLLLAIIPSEEHSCFSSLFYCIKFLLCHAAS